MIIATSPLTARSLVRTAAPRWPRSRAVRHADPAQPIETTIKASEPPVYPYESGT